MSKRPSVIQVKINFTQEDGVVFERLSQVPGGRGRRNREKYLRRLIQAAVETSIQPSPVIGKMPTSQIRNPAPNEQEAPLGQDSIDEPRSFDDPFGIGKFDIAAAGGG
jgi:hypothetical protein